MDTTVVVALISLLGTLVGSITGVLVSNRLSNYRIEQLEKKIDKYANNSDEMKERLIIVEQRTTAAHERIDDVVHQLKITENRKRG